MRPFGASDYLIVISHDCDVVRDRLDDEPDVEVMVARSVTGAELDGNLTNGKNPRAIQFRLDHPIGVIGLAAFERYTLPRPWLANLTPSGELSADDKLVLGRWLASRYSRAAFPDAFNDRTTAVRSDLASLVKKPGRPLTAVLLALDTYDELGPDASYSVELIGLVREDIEESAALDAEKAIAAIAGRLGACQGIDLLDWRVESEASVTVADIRALRAWDLAHVSARYPNHEPPAPAGP
jgi:hypothetical protein